MHHCLQQNSKTHQIGLALIIKYFIRNENKFTLETCKEVGRQLPGLCLDSNTHFMLFLLVFRHNVMLIH